MWYEAKLGDEEWWINETFIKTIAFKGKQFLAVVEPNPHNPIELTGRISPVPFPERFLEVKENKVKCICCDGLGVHLFPNNTLLPKEVVCGRCNGTGKVEMKCD